MRTPSRKRVAAALRQRITSGEFGDGLLPTAREIAEEYGVGLGTVNRALVDLEGEGLVTLRQGARTMVRRPLLYERRLVGEVFDEHDLVLAGEVDPGGLFERWTQAHEDVQVVAEYREVPAPARAALLLQVEVGAVVLERTWVYTTDGQPYQLARSYLPLLVASAAGMTGPEAEVKGRGTMWQLERQGGLPVRYVQRRLSSRMPDPGERAALILPPGTPVFDRWGCMRLADGTPLEAGVTTIPADGVEFVVDMDLQERTAR